MQSPEFHAAYAEQNRRDQVGYSTLATVLSMVLNLCCSIMDFVVYPQHAALFFQVRICSIGVVALVWVWFVRTGKKHNRVFGVTWYASPLAIILWMIYYANDEHSPYYAGLNIILLAVGVLSPWTYVQNFVSAVMVLLTYIFVCLTMEMPQPLATIINNTTFLVLTAVIVVASSLANSRQRFREFELRWELDKSRREVEANNRRLVELDEAKSRFFANISHELRTPLTLMIGPLEALLNHHRQNLTQDSLALLQTMHGNSLRLLRLINDLLNIVRLESGKLEVRREPVMVEEFIKALGSSARQMAEDKGIQLSVSASPEIGCVALDRDKTEKIILNLLFNALKFTPNGGTVSIRCERVAEELVFAVTDTGVGIPKSKLPNVFTRFFQADDSSSRKYQGVGIGLSLVKEFTELQGGSVAVDSVEAKGSTFTVRLPFIGVQPGESTEPVKLDASGVGQVTQAEAPAGSQEWLSDLYRRAERTTPSAKSVPDVSDEAGDAAQKPTVLIADDEPDMLRFMSSQLRSHYRIIEAPDGQKAVDLAKATPPDLVLTDMMMPGKDGLDVCRELRAESVTRFVPVVMITARADEETKLAALAAGANDFLPKPFSITELHVRVKNLLDAGRFQRQLERQNVELEDAISQLRQTQDQLVVKEKQASLGVWSAGIIHEMNNPLNFARTGLYALRNKEKHLPPDQQPDFKELVADIEDGIKRVHLIVSDLRTYAHPGKTDQVEEVFVEEILRIALRFFSGDLQGQVEVIKNIPEGLTVFVNRNRLVQVLGNLMQNAVDALKLKTFPADQHPTITIDGQQCNGRSKIIVRDNGPGIKEEDVGKIFDPFFTTKEVGRGMGLGLGICYRIVQGFGGGITVRTELGKFCEFTLDLPAERVETDTN